MSGCIQWGNRIVVYAHVVRTYTYMYMYVQHLLTCAHTMTSLLEQKCIYTVHNVFSVSPRWWVELINMHRSKHPETTSKEIAHWKWGQHPLTPLWGKQYTCRVKSVTRIPAAGKGHKQDATILQLYHPVWCLFLVGFISKKTEGLLSFALVYFPSQEDAPYH